MSDDRLLSALRRLGEQELPISSDRAIRGRLETVWTTRAQGRAGWSFDTRRFAPVLAALVLIAALGGAAHGAGADSPLWEVRVALETAGSYLRLSADDRVAYLLDLVQTRTEEAARQEVLGNAGAAAKARAAASSAVVELDGKLPRIETAIPVPSATPPVVSASPTQPPANSPSASPSSNGSSVPAAQLPAAGSATPARTVAPPAAPTPVKTEPPRTPTPTPSASAKPSMTITGTVRDSAGAPVSGACITTSPTIPASTTSCITKSTNGTYGFTANVTPGQTITLYGYLTTPTGTFAGSATSPATPSITVMPSITLTLRK